MSLPIRVALGKAEIMREYPKGSPRRSLKMLGCWGVPAASNLRHVESGVS